MQKSAPRVNCMGNAGGGGGAFSRRTPIHHIFQVLNYSLFHYEFTEWYSLILKMEMRLG